MFSNVYARNRTDTLPVTGTSSRKKADSAATAASGRRQVAEEGKRNVDFATVEPWRASIILSL
jgi:hypothetical protein